MTGLEVEHERWRRGESHLCLGCSKLPPHEGCSAICAACAPPTGSCRCAGCVLVLKARREGRCTCPCHAGGTGSCEESPCATLTPAVPGAAAHCPPGCRGIHLSTGDYSGRDYYSGCRCLGEKCDCPNHPGAADESAHNDATTKEK